MLLLIDILFKKIVLIIYILSFIACIYSVNAIFFLGIPSTQLYPIHHLDDKEFFPGDFVVDQKEESRMYGVVQSVDHQGRTAKIKWFRTYTSSQNPE